jgi:hypothetical protein
VDVDVARTLETTYAYVRRFVVLSESQLVVGALWAFHTHAFAAAETTPYLNVTSPERESGKTRLFETLEPIVARPVKVSGTTTAALARAVSADPPPTLLLDESDNTFKRDREYVATLLAILNDGYRRGGKALICLPPKWEPGFLPVFSPKAIAGIGALPDTVASRSIPIRMKRKARDERVDRFRIREAVAAAEPLFISLASLADLHVGNLAEARPDIPEALGDRASDVWEPLLAIADLAGGEWPGRARQAALDLCAVGAVDDDSTGVQLLAAIRDKFTDERMACSALVEVLNADDQLPYGGWNDGKGLTTRELGRKLAPFDIKAKTIRLVGDVRANGYEREQFADAWERYLPIPEEFNRDTVTTRMVEPKTAEKNRDKQAGVTVAKNGANPHEQSDVTVSRFESAGIGANATEWLARDGAWRSLEDDPPTFADEIVDTREVPAA